MDSLFSLPTTAYLLLGDTILFPLPRINLPDKLNPLHFSPLKKKIQIPRHYFWSFHFFPDSSS